MKKLLLSCALVSALGLPISQAQAGLLVEPVLGYTWGQEIDFDNGENYDDGGQGMAYGGRLGYQTGSWQFGADYLRSGVDMDDGDFDDDVDLTEWAAFVGYEFPVFFRVYGGYIFSAEGETKLNGINTDLEDGTGFKLGVGFTGLPVVDINLEYRNGTFDKVKAAGIDGGEADYNATMLSVSAPFDFF